MFKQVKITNFEDSAEFEFAIDLPVALEKAQPWLYNADLPQTEKGLLELLKLQCSTLAAVAVYQDLNQYGISNIPEDHANMCLLPIRGTHGVMLTSADVYEYEMYVLNKPDTETWPAPIEAPKW